MPPPQPSLTGFRLRSVPDALYIAKLASAGRLPATSEYMRCRDQESVTVGHVYVFRTIPGLRWSDGLRTKTDPSSTHRTEFLTYPIPHPPTRDGVHPASAWVRKRKNFTITRSDGVMEEWEVATIAAAYDYDKAYHAHGNHLRTLEGGIADLLLPGLDPAGSTSSQPAAPGVLPEPLQEADVPLLLVDTAPRNSPAPSAWSLHPTSPVTSPVATRRIPAPPLFRRPSPRPRPAAVENTTRYHPYAARRPWCDDEMLARLACRRWLARGR
ncbi:hypothetical protein AURDEDRAFT_126492 [Auricularia subglabra TFB-10046 SS5]|nr:hypothetical protein AURDEDRAFT_126492 [Auricularia subglabra TFB-10046 SS5]